MKNGEAGWSYLDGDVVVYRAYSFGSCIRSLVASRLGETATPPGATLRAALDRSSSLEDEAIRRYEQVTGHEVIWQQKTVELDVDDKLIVRGHVDGLDRQDDGIIEVKCLGQGYFDKWNAGGWEGLGSLGLKYLWQAALYGHATDRKVRFVIFNKDAEVTDGDDDIIIEPWCFPGELVDIKDIVERVAMIEDFVDRDEYPECDRGCTRWDAYGHIHLFTDGPKVVKGEAGDDLLQLLERHYELKQLIADLTDERDSISDRIKDEFGEGKHAVGPFVARVEKRKGSARIDTRRLRKERPDVAEEFTVIGMPTMVLNVDRSGG